MHQVDNEDNDIPIDDSDRCNMHEEKETRSKLSMQYTKEAHRDIMPPSEYSEHMRNLNPGQRQIVCTTDLGARLLLLL